MDNLAHSLAGAALGEAGLKKKTGLGLATLIIAANIADIDALGLLVGENLAWRRGWTHGPIAWLVLPPLLAGAMFAFDRLQAHMGRRPAGRPPVNFRWLLALTFIGTLSHPLLDFLNTYGIRCLMPFSDRWFYGDALFIIDIWVWLTLGAGVWLSRRRRKRHTHLAGRPAIYALSGVAVYAVAMGTGSIAAERMAAAAVEAKGLGKPNIVVASPVPIDPFRRKIVFGVGDAYGFGDFRWSPAPVLKLEPELVPTNMGDPAIALAAKQSKEAADFLYWSRLPFAILAHEKGRTIVTIGDARYTREPGKGPFAVSVSITD